MSYEPKGAFAPAYVYAACHCWPLTVCRFCRKWTTRGGPADEQTQDNPRRRARGRQTAQAAPRSAAQARARSRSVDATRPRPGKSQAEKPPVPPKTPASSSKLTKPSKLPANPANFPQTHARQHKIGGMTLQQGMLNSTLPADIGGVANLSPECHHGDPPAGIKSNTSFLKRGQQTLLHSKQMRKGASDQHKWEKAHVTTFARGPTFRGELPSRRGVQ